MSVLWVRASVAARRALDGVARGARRGAEIIGLRSTPPAPDAPLAMVRDGRLESLLAQVAADQAAERAADHPAERSAEHVTRSTERPIARSERPTAVEIKRAG